MPSLNKYLILVKRKESFFFSIDPSLENNLEIEDITFSCFYISLSLFT
jgi:hypothetical protein